MPSVERKYEFASGLWQVSLKTCPLYIFGGLKLKINNFDEEYLDKLEEKEINQTLKYKKRDKKIKESFALYDLLSVKQRKQILEYTNNGR